jgi:hypothetical protein
LHPLGSILQYADDLVVYVSGNHAVRDCLQTSLTRLMTWFGDQGLSLSANKSEKMVFSRKHENPKVLKSISGQSWGAHPACLVLHESTVCSVIEYGGVCFAGISDCHMRRLKRIQWRAGRIYFGLMWFQRVSLR